MVFFWGFVTHNIHMHNQNCNIPSCTQSPLAHIPTWETRIFKSKAYDSYFTLKSGESTFRSISQSCKFKAIKYTNICYKTYDILQISAVILLNILALWSIWFCSHSHFITNKHEFQSQVRTDRSSTTNTQTVNQNSQNPGLCCTIYLRSRLVLTLPKF